MSSPEVDWVLSQLGSVVGSITAPLKRIDRDESQILEDSIRTRKGELQEANYVGATLAGRTPTAVGTEYDHSLETVVEVRVEGLASDEWGHIDPDGADGVPFDKLVRDVKGTLLQERSYPNAGPTEVAYTDLQIVNESPQSARYRDHYRTGFDVVFNGFETLP